MTGIEVRYRGHRRLNWSISGEGYGNKSLLKVLRETCMYFNKREEPPSYLELRSLLEMSLLGVDYQGELTLSIWYLDHPEQSVVIRGYTPVQRVSRFERMLG
jgi:hypothetical protein